jgi:hypothetical protein
VEIDAERSAFGIMNKKEKFLLQFHRTMFVEAIKQKTFSWAAAILEDDPSSYGSLSFDEIYWIAYQSLANQTLAPIECAIEQAFMVYLVGALGEFTERGDNSEIDSLVRLADRIANALESLWQAFYPLTVLHRDLNVFHRLQYQFDYEVWNITRNSQIVRFAHQLPGTMEIGRHAASFGFIPRLVKDGASFDLFRSHLIDVTDAFALAVSSSVIGKRASTRSGTSELRMKSSRTRSNGG